MAGVSWRGGFAAQPDTKIFKKVLSRIFWYVLLSECKPFEYMYVYCRHNCVSKKGANRNTIWDHIRKPQLTLDITTVRCMYGCLALPTLVGLFLSLTLVGVFFSLQRSLVLSLSLSHPHHTPILLYLDPAKRAPLSTIHPNDLRLCQGCHRYHEILPLSRPCHLYSAYFLPRARLMCTTNEQPHSWARLAATIFKDFIDIIKDLINIFEDPI